MSKVADDLESRLEIVALEAEITSLIKTHHPSLHLQSPEKASQLVE